MITDVDAVVVAWVAGIVEGEGYLRITTSPQIRVKMGDKDVIDRLSKLWDSETKARVDKRLNHSTMFEATIYGSVAVEWMRRIYPLMGQRRKAKILEILDTIGTRHDNSVSRAKSKAMGKQSRSNR